MFKWIGMGFYVYLLGSMGVYVVIIMGGYVGGYSGVLLFQVDSVVINFNDVINEIVVIVWLLDVVLLDWLLEFLLVDIVVIVCWLNCKVFIDCFFNLLFWLECVVVDFVDWVLGVFLVQVMDVLVGELNMLCEIFFVCNYMISDIFLFLLFGCGWKSNL